MRKADYAHLARCVKRMRTDATAAIVHASRPEASLVALARKQAAEDLARDFARAAAVDRVQFLTACGLAPD